MSRILLALASIALAGSGAACSGGGGGDGGNLKWQKDPKKGFELASFTGKPMLVYFTSDGWGACGVLSAGAFSEDSVVQATKDVVCVYVDLEWGRKHADLAERYGVRQMPTVIYADPEGEEVSRMRSFEPTEMVGELQSLVRDHARRFGASESSLPGATGGKKARGR